MKYTFFLFVILLSSRMYCQNIELNHLISINSKDITEIEPYLSELGWTYTERVKENDAEYLSFKYKTNGKTTGILSKSFGVKSFVMLSFYDKRKKDSFLKNLMSLGFKKGNTKLVGDNIITIYDDSKLICTVGVSPNDEYNISIYSKY